MSSYGLFFFSSRRRHTRSVSAFLLNRSSDLHSFPSWLPCWSDWSSYYHFNYSGYRWRSEERRVGKECRHLGCADDYKENESVVRRQAFLQALVDRHTRFRAVFALVRDGGQLC